MRRKFLALVALLVISSLARAQDAAIPDARPFNISSVNTAFAMQAEFRGEYRVYPDRVELRVAEGHVRIGEHCPYKGRRLLSGVRIGLAASVDGRRWKITHWGQEFFLEQVMSPGDTYSLGSLYFYIPKDDTVDLSRHWLVVQVEDTALDVPEEERLKGYAFVHSRRDIFTRGR